MAIKEITVKFIGISPLLQNNPQTVDVFNRYSKLKKPLSDKRGKAKTDDVIQKLRDIEVESKLYFDDDIGVYIPSRWVLAAVAQNAYALTKISKAKTRGAVFTTEDKFKLNYDGMKGVKTKLDIVHNPKFVVTLILPQQNVRLAKSAPIFHKWSFNVTLEFDDAIINREDLVTILEYSAKYSGFGDFRPTYGRALCEVTDEQ